MGFSTCVTETILLVMTNNVEGASARQIFSPVHKCRYLVLSKMRFESSNVVFVGKSHDQCETAVALSQGRAKSTVVLFPHATAPVHAIMGDACIKRANPT